MGKLAVVSDLHADINRFTTEDLAQLLSVLKEKKQIGSILPVIWPTKWKKHKQLSPILSNTYRLLLIGAIMKWQI